MPNEKAIPQQIPIEKIHDLPGVPSVKLPDKSYGGMVSSILVGGVKEAVILRQREDGEYELVDGDRRRRASELAKLKTVPDFVYDMTLKEAQEYRKGRDNKDKLIPGKLVENDGKDQKTPIAPDGKTDNPGTGKGEEKGSIKPAETAPAGKVEKPTEDKADKVAQPTAPAEKAAQPAVPAANADKSGADKVEKPTAPASDGKKAPAEAPPTAKTDKTTPDKADKPTSPAEKAAKPATAKGLSAKPKDEAPVGTTAEGPMGTSITKILDPKLDPPTAADKKALPIPGDGEAFSVVLHPGYLKKAEINTFSVNRDSDDFKELFKSIERFGVNTPVQARFGKDGELEIISGQRRHVIASELNYPVPAIIQKIDDDDARILVADGNLHREHISTYDLSRAVKMKSDAMKRKAGRRSKADGGPKREYTDTILAQEMGMSESKLNRLMKLSMATERVCDLVDEGKLPLSVAYNIAFLTVKQQETVVDLIDINVKVNNENTALLKKVFDEEKGKLTDEKIRGVLEGTYPPKPVEKAAPAPAAPTAPATPSMAPTNIPASPDVQTTAPAAAPAPVTPDNSAQGQPTATIPPAPSAAPVVGGEEKPEPVDRENTYETKVVLRGDRLRKYFPDVSMTPREIEDSVYDALEERRQRQAKAQSKAGIFKDPKAPTR